MSLTLAPVDLSAAQVGASATVSFGALVTVPTPLQPGPAPLAHALLQNESGVGLQVTFPRGNVQFYLAAGEWRLVALDPNEQNFRYTVQYTLANPPVSSLFFTYYAPGETPSPPGILGNSPIGLSGSVPTSVTQVIQDGQTSGQTIVESTPSGGGGQTILLTTDGHLTLAMGINFGASVGGSRSFLVYDNANHQVVYWTPQGGAVALGHLFVTWNGAAQVDTFSIGGQFGGAPTWLASGGAVGGLAGQATAGSFGVPVIVAQALSVNITDTFSHNVLVYAVPASGWYRINCTLRIANGSPPQKILLTASYTDPDGAGGSDNVYFINSTAITASGGLDLASAMDAVTTTFGNRTVGIPPEVVRAKVGTNITVSYQDTFGTPNDFVTAIIERLA